MLNVRMSVNFWGFQPAGGALATSTFVGDGRARGLDRGLIVREDDVRRRRTGVDHDAEVDRVDVERAALLAADDLDYGRDGRASTLQEREQPDRREHRRQARTSFLYATRCG